MTPGNLFQCTESCATHPTRCIIVEHGPFLNLDPDDPMAFCPIGGEPIAFKQIARTVDVIIG